MSFLNLFLYPILLLLTPNLVACPSNEYTHLASTYMPLIQDDVAKSCQIIANLGNENAENLKRHNFSKVTFPLPTDQSLQIKCCYELLASLDQKAISQESCLMDSSTIQTLDVFKPCTQNEKDIFSVIDQTCTTFGKIELQRKLLFPEKNIGELKKQQEFVQLLISDQDFYNQVEHELQDIANSQAHFLWLWFIFNKTPHAESLLKSVNPFKKTPNALHFELYRIFYISLYVKPAHTIVKTTKISAFLLGLLLAYSSPFIVAFYLDDDFAREMKEKMITPFCETLGSNWVGNKIVTFGKSIKIEDSLFFIALLSFLAPYAYYGLSKYSTDDIWFNKRLNELHARINTVANLFKASKNLGFLIKNNQYANSLIDFYPSLIHPAHPQTSETKKALTMLDSSTFASNSFFNNKGKVIAASAMLLKAKTSFIKLIIDIGKIDALFSVAKLFKKQQQTTQPYCFVDFDSSEKTVFVAEDVWSPTSHNEMSMSLELQNPENYCLLEYTSDEEHKFFSKALPQAAAIGRSLGIAPAKEMRMSAFSRIQTSCIMNEGTKAFVSLDLQALNTHNIPIQTFPDYAAKNHNKLFTVTIPASVPG